MRYRPKYPNIESYIFLYFISWCANVHAAIFPFAAFNTDAQYDTQAS